MMVKIENSLDQLNGTNWTQPATTSHKDLANAWLNGSVPVPAPR
jgi:hypothetical protein